MELNKELYRQIESDCDTFNKLTEGYHDVQVEDVLYSFLFSDEQTLRVLHDWDEGEFNDPYWDKENNRHSTESFFIKMNEKLKTNG